MNLCQELIQIGMCFNFSSKIQTGKGDVCGARTGNGPLGLYKNGECKNQTAK